jgi:hypothetical protein
MEGFETDGLERARLEREGVKDQEITLCFKPHVRNM